MRHFYSILVLILMLITNNTVLNAAVSYSRTPKTDTELIHKKKKQVKKKHKRNKKLRRQKKTSATYAGDLIPIFFVTLWFVGSIAMFVIGLIKGIAWLWIFGAILLGVAIIIAIIALVLLGGMGQIGRCS